MTEVKDLRGNSRPEADNRPQVVLTPGPNDGLRQALTSCFRSVETSNTPFDRLLSKLR